MKVVLKEGAIFEKASPLEAGYDMVNVGDTVVISSGDSAIIDIGVAVDLPVNMLGILTHRSSLGFKSDSILSLGIIDHTFPNTMKAKAFNLGKYPVTIEKGERFCQLVILEKPEVEIEFVDKIDRTGKDGFGSSGRF